MRDYVCRPPADAQQEANRTVGDGIVWRLGLNGKWAPDNGAPGLAFAAGVIHYYPDINCGCFGSGNETEKCISRRSAAKVLQQVSCANGRRRPATKR